MFKILTKYVSVGVLNTALHWIVFLLCIYGAGSAQATANLIGFAVAVSFSFFANARFTFKAEATAKRYVLYIVFMGGLSFATGRIADLLALPPLLTLVVFSAISLVCGFLYANYVVFKDVK